VNTDPTSVARDFVECYEKRDGSMLTPIITDNGNIVFKTKKSFYSDVANSANLSIPPGVKRICQICLDYYNSTPIWEYTHPEHKIVIDYPSSVRWTLLAIRDNESGEYYPYETLQAMEESHDCLLIPRLEMSWNEIQRSIENDKGIEGYVLLLKDGRRVKYKTAWYLQMHRTMTELRVRDVAEAVVNETVDDLKSLVASQGKDIAAIEDIENQVANELHWLRSEVNTIVQSFIGETFKDAALALKGTQLFSLVMSELRGKEPNYIDFWKKNFLKTYSLKVIYNPSFSRDE
jgi:T4 RnlA family RNA ligase